MSNAQDATLAYQKLQPDDILTSVESLGYQCDGRFLALNSYENRVYRIGIEDQPPVVTKFYRPARWSDDGHPGRTHVLDELAEQDIPVVPPATMHDSKTLHNMALSASPFMPSMVDARRNSIIWTYCSKSDVWLRAYT